MPRYAGLTELLEQLTALLSRVIAASAREQNNELYLKLQRIKAELQDDSSPLPTTKTAKSLTYAEQVLLEMKQGEEQTVQPVQYREGDLAEQYEEPQVVDVELDAMVETIKAENPEMEYPDVYKLAAKRLGTTKG